MAIYAIMHYQCLLLELWVNMYIAPTLESVMDIWMISCSQFVDNWSFIFHNVDHGNYNNFQ